jgi:hypothetical protein
MRNALHNDQTLFIACSCLCVFCQAEIRCAYDSAMQCIANNCILCCCTRHDLKVQHEGMLKGFTSHDALGHRDPTPTMYAVSHAMQSTDLAFEDVRLSDDQVILFSQEAPLDTLPMRHPTLGSNERT